MRTIPEDNFKAVSINLDDNPDEARDKLLQAVTSVDTGDGVVIIVDMFGGTPSNLSLSLLAKGKIEIVTGANLPMIIEAASKSTQVVIDELVNILTSSGQRAIRSAGEILNTKILSPGYLPPPDHDQKRLLFLWRKILPPIKNKL